MQITRTILIVTAAAAALAATPADAGPSRAELLAGRADHQRGAERHRGYADHDRRQHERRDRHAHRASGHYRGGERHQYQYASARRYAANAVRQARQAHRLGFYPDHPRWSLNFRRHFEWALRADSYKLERETRKRAHKLRELRRYASHPYGHGY